jgi:PDZ domain
MVSHILFTALIAVLSLSSGSAFSTRPLVAYPMGAMPSTTSCFAAGATGIQTGFMWNAGLSFGKGQFKFYNGFDDFMKVFPEEDRLAFPETFQLPKGVYEIVLKKPLGIVFEEFEDGSGGLFVQDLVPGGNAERTGQVQVGDVLVGMTAVKVVGAKYERRLIPARKFDFDTMVGAIGSNDERFSCTNVILMLERPREADSAAVDTFMEFFEPPFDNPWKQRQ